MDYKKSKTLRTIKSASPEVLFARFLQKQAPAPAPVQLNTWETDGGMPISPEQEDFVMIGGQKCCTFFQKLRAHVFKYWRITKYYYHHQQAMLLK